jgi:carbamoyltransferase
MKYTVSIHTKHDANMTISSGDRIFEYIEFEKVVGKRYFSFSEKDKFEEEFQTCILPFLKELNNEIVKINFCWLSEFQKNIFKKTFPNCEFEEKKHHISHAYSLYAFTKPQPNDLIISFDGGGDEEDCFKLFQWEDKSLNLLKEVKLNLGTPYRVLGLYSDEIKSTPIFEYETNLHLPGKIMGLAPMGNIEPTYIEPIKRFYIMFRKEKTTIYEKLKSLLDELEIGYDSNLKIDKQTARNILQTSQKVFQDLFFENVKEIFNDKYNRILLVGGCSLNIKLNTEVFLRTQKEVFVSPISGDCGISLGATISDMDLKRVEPFKNAFIGLKCSDDITQFARKYNSKRVTTKDLAEELAKGKIIATMIDRIEAGARSLGNRSLLASPLQKGMKDKLNKIKEREFFRPVAPTVSDTMQDVYFEKVPVSKYMSFSPKIKSEFKILLSEIVHYDGTCRIQTATKEDGFIYELVKEFGKLTGIEILINTSFNVKGKPIINNLAEAFELLEVTAIDGLYVDSLLFKK